LRPLPIFGIVTALLRAGRFYAPQRGLPKLIPLPKTLTVVNPENLNFLPSIKAHRSKLLLEESLSGTPDQKAKNKKSKL